MDKPYPPPHKISARVIVTKEDLTDVWYAPASNRFLKFMKMSPRRQKKAIRKVDMDAVIRDINREPQKWIPPAGLDRGLINRDTLYLIGNKNEN